MLLFAALMIGTDEHEQSYFLVTWVKAESEAAARELLRDAALNFPALRGKRLEFHLAEIPADQLHDVDGVGDISPGESWETGLEGLDLDL